MRCLGLFEVQITRGVNQAFFQQLEIRFRGVKTGGVAMDCVVVVVVQQCSLCLILALAIIHLWRKSVLMALPST